MPFLADQQVIPVTAGPHFKVIPGFFIIKPFDILFFRYIGCKLISVTDLPRDAIIADIIKNLYRSLTSVQTDKRSTGLPVT